MSSSSERCGIRKPSHRALRCGNRPLRLQHAATPPTPSRRCSALFEFYPPDEHLGLRRQVASTLRAHCHPETGPRPGGNRTGPGGGKPLSSRGSGRNAITAGNFEKNPPPSLKRAGSLGPSPSTTISTASSVRVSSPNKSGSPAPPNPQALEMNLKGIFLYLGRNRQLSAHHPLFRTSPKPPAALPPPQVAARRRRLLPLRGKRPTLGRFKTNPSTFEFCRHDPRVALVCAGRLPLSGRPASLRLWADEPGTYRVTPGGIHERDRPSLRGDGGCLATGKQSCVGTAFIVGQVLVIPAPAPANFFHEVRAGESLSVIARRYSITVASLREATG